MREEKQTVRLPVLMTGWKPRSTGGKRYVLTSGESFMDVGESGAAGFFQGHFGVSLLDEERPGERVVSTELF